MRLPAFHHDSRIFHISLLLGLLVCSLTSFAQSQAPVIWGEARWCGVNCSFWDGQLIAPMGDTLVAVDYGHDSLDTSHFYPLTNHSLDNGNTWNDWLRLDSGQYNDIQISIVGSEGVVHAFGYGYNFGDGGWWFLRSSNGGQNWNPIEFGYNFGILACIASGARVICAQSRQSGDHYVRNALISEDRGEHWNTAGTMVWDSTDISDKNIASTRNYLLLTGVRSTNNGQSINFVYTRADRNGLNWSTYQPFPGQPVSYEMMTSSLAADTGSETAIFLNLWYPNGGNGINVYYYRTTNGGITWSGPIALTTNAPLYNSAWPAIFCRGKLWGVAWREIVGNDPSQWGVYWRFSANHGKNWYPSQYVDANYLAVDNTTGQFVGDEIRLYWAGAQSRNSTTANYRTITGVLTPDTLPPAITSFQMTPDSIHAQDSLHFHVTISENDTLSEATVVILDTTGTKTTLDLVKMDSTTYEAAFLVPFAGLFQYRFEAEDFWENVSHYPGNGAFEFVARSPLNIGANPELTRTFRLTVFPNPFNAETRIDCTLPVTAQTTITLNDLLGRTVLILADKIIEAGSHEFMLDGSRLPSGIYFLRLQAGAFAQTRKIVLLK